MVNLIKRSTKYIFLWCSFGDTCITAAVEEANQMFAKTGKGIESKIENVTMPLYRSMIRTIFDYRVLFPSFLKDILKLQKVQKRAASLKVLP